MLAVDKSLSNILAGKDAEVIQAVRDLANANPEFIYEAKNPSYRGQCFYVEDGKPSCIVGQALAKLGLTIDQLSLFDNEVTGDISAEAVGKVLGLNDITRTWLRDVQASQDAGLRWAAAVARADGTPVPLMDYKV